MTASQLAPLFANFGRCLTTCIFLVGAIAACSQTDRVPLEKAMHEVEHGAYPGIDAIVIARHGEIIYRYYANGMTPETLHDSRSSFKSVAALLAGIALDKGYIKTLDEKVYMLFPQYETFANMDKRKADMTIRDLLEMKSGFDCEEWEGTKDCEEAMAASDDWLKFSLDLPMAHKPGTHWAYTSSSTMIVGGVIESVTDMSVIQFADSFFFRPLGITNYRWTQDPAHHGMTAGSFYILPMDMLKIGQLILNRGIWNGKWIVSEEWIVEATDPITEIEGFSNVGISNTEGAIPQPTYYGYQWYNERVVSDAFSYNVIFASGNGGQYIMAIPELDTVVVFMGNTYNSRASKLPFQVLMNAIIPALEAQGY